MGACNTKPKKDYKVNIHGEILDIEGNNMPTDHNYNNNGHVVVNSTCCYFDIIKSK